MANWLPRRPAPADELRQFEHDWRLVHANDEPTAPAAKPTSDRTARVEAYASDPLMQKQHPGARLRPVKPRRKASSRPARRLVARLATGLQEHHVHYRMVGRRPTRAHCLAR